jgi:hypothetical protein
VATPIPRGIYLRLRSIILSRSALICSLTYITNSPAAQTTRPRDLSDAASTLGFQNPALLAHFGFARLKRSCNLGYGSPFAVRVRPELASYACQVLDMQG